MPYRPFMSASVMHQFDIFAQLVACGTISDSAGALGIAPAEIVEGMNALEDRLGLQIFTMTDGRVDLTDMGRRLVSALGSMTPEMQEQWIDGITGAVVENPEPEPLDRRTARSTIPPDAAFRPAPSAREDTPAVPEEAPAEPEPEPQKAVTKETERATPRHFVPQDPKQPPLSPPPPAPDPVRSIVLASHPAIFSHFQEALVAFEQASPDIGITMRLAGLGLPEVAGLFARGEADIAYFYALEEPQDLPSRYAWSERISLFVGEGHPLAKKATLAAEDLATVPYVALARDTLARTLTEEALARDGLIVGTAISETDNLYEIMKRVQSSPCYFAAFGPMARDFGKMPGIARLAWAQGLPQVQVRQAVRQELAEDPAVVALAEFLFR